MLSVEVRAVGKNIAISTVKARIPAQVVRKMNAREAVGVLTYMRKGAAPHIKKVIESALANAKNNYNLDPEALYISEIRVDQGPITKFNAKRFKTGSRGGYRPFTRKYCHITVKLQERIVEESKTKKSKVEKEEKVSEPKVKKKQPAKRAPKKSVAEKSK